jgi:ferritin
MRHIIIGTLAAAIAFTGNITAQDHVDQDELISKGKIIRPAMHEEMAGTLNGQFQVEMESAYLYLGISTYFAEQGLDGFAHWMSLHAKEELDHAMKVYNFLLDRGVKIELPVISAPATKWDSPVAAFETALTHEIFVSQLIKQEYAMSQELQEYDTGEFVLWFLREQVEEENLFESVLNRLYLIEDSHPAALMLLDLEMGKREV